MIMIELGVPLRHGDEVLLVRGDFPAMTLPWHLLEQGNVRVRWIDAPDGPLTADRLEESISPRACSARGGFIRFSAMLSISRRNCLIWGNDDDVKQLLDRATGRPIKLSVTTMSRRAQATDPKLSALDRDAAALQQAVADLVRVYQFRDRDRICCHDVSVTQCYALETLVEHGSMRLSGLAERLFLDKSTTSRVVNTLVRKGYVEQRADATDGRATVISATRQGQRLCAGITSDLVEQQKQLLDDLAPEIRAGVIQVIQQLAQAADARFRSGVAGGCCTRGSETASCA